MSASRMATSDTSGKSKPFAQQVDAHDHIKHAHAQVAQNFGALNRVHFRVQIVDFDAHFQQVIGQIFRHPLGERRHQHPLALGGAFVDFAQQIIHLPLDRPHFHFRIEHAGGADDLAHDLRRMFPFHRCLGVALVKMAWLTLPLETRRN